MRVIAKHLLSSGMGGWLVTAATLASRAEHADEPGGVCEFQNHYKFHPTFGSVILDVR